MHACSLTRPAAAAEGCSPPRSRPLIRWDEAGRGRPKATRWSAADAVLIDEAAGLIERLPSFGHVVVDEAQDLSPMQCRAIARRSEHGSITLLGDLAQGTAPWAATDWRDILRHLGKPDAPVVPLTIGFRVPAAVVALANRLLPALAVDVPAARVAAPRRRARRAYRWPTWTRRRSPRCAAALAHEGSVGVIAADAAVDRAARGAGRRRHRGRDRRRRRGRGAGHRGAGDAGQGPGVRPRGGRRAGRRSSRPSRAACTGSTWC